MKEAVKKQFEAALSATGIDLKIAAAGVVEFAAMSAARLASATHEVSFPEMVQAEADRVFLFAAKRAVRSADAADAQAIGLIRGVLLGFAGA